MNTRKLSQLLILGGVALIVLASVWFMTAYSSLMDTMSRYGGNDVAAKLMACLYSSPAICQGASFMSDGPAYSPVVFWIGVIALLVGVILRFAMPQPAAPAGSDGETPQEGNLLGLIPAGRYVMVAYVVALVSVLLPVLVWAALALCLMGLFVFRSRLSAVDASHLAAIGAVSGAVLVLRFILPVGFIWLLLSLVQLALYYIGLNSYRSGRTIGIDNFREEARLAARPIIQRFSGGIQK